MVAVRTALPLSFIGLGAGLLVFMLLQRGPLLTRFSSSFAAAFGVMSALLLVLLTFDLAGRRRVSQTAALAAAAAAFALSLPYAHAASLFALAKALGSSGLFLAIGIALVTVTAIRLARRTFGALGGTLLAGLVVVGLAGGLLARGISLTGWCANRAGNFASRSVSRPIRTGH